jgi:hypothetical protein
MLRSDAVLPIEAKGETYEPNRRPYTINKEEPDVGPGDPKTELATAAL